MRDGVEPPEKPPEPIRSRREDDPELHGAIDAFVVGLGERVDGLQDLEQAPDPPGLGHRAGELAAEAESLGYPLLARVARAVSERCAAGDADAVRDALVALTRIAQRVRRGHRGAA